MSTSLPEPLSFESKPLDESLVSRQNREMKRTPVRLSNDGEDFRDQLQVSIPNSALTGQRRITTVASRSAPQRKASVPIVLPRLR